MKKGEALKIKKLGLVIKHHQPEASLLAAEITASLLEQNIQTFFADESTQLAKDIIKNLGNKKKLIKIVTKPELTTECDLIVVLGGDGTYLSIARLMKKRSIPVMGINMGQLGFLTEFRRTEALGALKAVLNGVPPIIHERDLLEVTLNRKNRTLYQGLVVNDAVISKGAIARIIGMEMWVDSHWVNHVRADGMIVSTTTGSTAYALAAGGPLVEPSVPALVIAPICPHSLTLRPLVISDQSEIRIRLSDRPGHVLLTLDGQDVVDMKEDDVVTLRKFKKHSLKLIASPDRDFFGLLREKLKFGVRD
jgi:NAD+ kinase